jgi:hypothetical protein
LEQKTDSQSSGLNPIKAMTFGQSEVGRPSTSSRATISTGRSISMIIEYVCHAIGGPLNRIRKLATLCTGQLPSKA